MARLFQMENVDFREEEEKKKKSS